MTLTAVEAELNTPAETRHSGLLLTWAAVTCTYRQHWDLVDLSPAADLKRDLSN